MSDKYRINPINPGLIRDASHQEIDKLVELMKSGVLPLDTPFRLFAIGTEEVEWSNEGKPTKNGKWMCRIAVEDMLENAEHPQDMRQNIQAILYSDLPDAIVLPFRIDEVRKTQLEEISEPYYRLHDLTACVKSLRKIRGLTITDVPNEWCMKRPEEYEAARSWGEARRIWNALANHHAPDIIKNFMNYDASPSNSSAGPRLRLQRVVERTIFRDSAIMETFEAVRSNEIRLRGLGEVALDAVELMLSEDHPNLINPNIKMTNE